MLRLTKYLKPYIPLILLAIVLLFFQAMADLSLPDYMSKIVNIGIQQGGVETAVPVAIRESEMAKLEIFMSPDEKTRVQAGYSLIDRYSTEYTKDIALYPTLAKEPIYVLTTTNQTEINALNPIMGKSLLVVSGIEQALADPAKAAAAAKLSGFDLSKLPPGMDVFTVLAKLPTAQLSTMTTAMNSKFASMGDSVIIQAAASAVKAEYTTLGMDTSGVQNNFIISTGMFMLLLSLVSVICTVTVSLLSARAAAGVGRDLRRDVFRKVENFSNIEFDRFSTASLITRSTNDITQIQMLIIMLIRMAIYSPIIGVGGVIKAMGKDSSMWWIIAVAVGILIVMISIVFTVSLPKFKIIQKLIDRLNLVTRENLSGMMVIRAFNSQKFEEGRFDSANKDLTATSLFVNRIMVVMMPMMMLIMNGLSLLIVWVGAHQIAQSSMQVGDMMAFIQYAMQIVMAFLMLSFMFIIMPRASVSADRIADVVYTEPTILDPKDAQHFMQPFQGTVEFRNVTFRYPGAEEDVLHDISFTAKPGQTTAFIGSTGSGKSTIVNLIPRFYDVCDGSILLDNMDIRQVTQNDLRGKIGYVPQKGTLFSGTIESNLRFADQNASVETLVEAADIAQATEFINAKPEGMESEISQGGINVSGGQKQRLAIARALVKKPPIFIFDDSFSALDFKTDSALRKALHEKTGASTVLIVTQRISTIKNADQIVVLDDGRVVGKGTHDELMESCSTYREIALSQLSMEELS